MEQKMEQKMEAVPMEKDTERAVFEAVGRKITAIELRTGTTDKDELRLELEGGRTLVLMDSEQDCCENRYMTCDDDFKPFVGATLLGVQVNGASTNIEGEQDEVHEQQFLLIRTSQGTFTVASHNEHNGYYGGFALRAHMDDR